MKLQILCPKCTYEPKQTDRWQCTCGHIWNTFDTAAKCPACGYQWKDTACPACHKWSPHIDWYHITGLDDVLNQKSSKEEEKTRKN